MNAAKTLALAYDKPFIGVNHLNAHLAANFIDTELKPPFIALLVSGGHTQIIKVLRLVKSFDGQEMPVKDICASFQECVSSTLLKKVKKALEETGYKQVVLAGGVAANSEIRRKIFNLKDEGYEVYAPVMKYCTDNASMVASSALLFDNTFDDVNVEVFSRV